MLHSFSANASTRIRWGRVRIDHADSTTGCLSPAMVGGIDLGEGDDVLL